MAAVTTAVEVHYTLMEHEERLHATGRSRRDGSPPSDLPLQTTSDDSQSTTEGISLPTTVEDSTVVTPAVSHSINGEEVGTGRKHRRVDRGIPPRTQSALPTARNVTSATAQLQHSSSTCGGRMPPITVRPPTNYRTQWIEMINQGLTHPLIVKVNAEFVRLESRTPQNQKVALTAKRDSRQAECYPRQLRTVRSADFQGMAAMATDVQIRDHATGAAFMPTIGVDEEMVVDQSSHRLLSVVRVLVDTFLVVLLNKLNCLFSYIVATAIFIARGSAILGARSQWRGYTAMYCFGCTDRPATTAGARLQGLTE